MEEPLRSARLKEDMCTATPGPWLAVMQFGSWFVRQDPKNWDGNGYQHICALPAGRKATHYGEMFAANARLIAAAPDLLAACVALDENAPIDSEWGYCGCCRSNRGHEADCAVTLARAAILKATSSSEPKVSGSPSPAPTTQEVSDE